MTEGSRGGTKENHGKRDGKRTVGESNGGVVPKSRPNLSRQFSSHIIIRSPYESRYDAYHAFPEFSIPVLYPRKKKGKQSESVTRPGE